MTDPAASAVLEAFDAAQAAHLPPVVCYRAGIEAWRRAHPDQRPEYVTKKAVDVILAAKVSLRVDDARNRSARRHNLSSTPTSCNTATAPTKKIAAHRPYSISMAAPPLRSKRTIECMASSGPG